jgi:ATP-binding cassette subfamily C protein
MHWSLLRSVLAGHRRVVLALGAWSAVESVPTMLSGVLVAQALDRGFLAGHWVRGMLWLTPMIVMIGLGAWATRRCAVCVGRLVEPLRDELVRIVVRSTVQAAGSAREAQHGRMIARITDQVELVRNTTATVLSVLRTFVFTMASVLIGALSLLPEVAPLLVGPLVVTVAALGFSLPSLARQQRRALAADEDVAGSVATLETALRDTIAAGAESTVVGRLEQTITRQADATRSLTAGLALRGLIFGAGAWLPFVLVIADTPRLMTHGATAGAIVGTLTYLVSGLQPALQSVIRAMGTAATTMLVVLRWITDQAGYPVPAPRPEPGTGHPRRFRDLAMRQVDFTYGAGAEPVVRALDLSVEHGDHLAIVGPSGIGKSTLASIMSGILVPQGGRVLIGGTPLTDLGGTELARLRVLIPQEAYVFRGTLRENLTYLSPGCHRGKLDRAIGELGLEPIVDDVGSLDADVVPQALSAGQRQLIAAARAYLSPAWLAILDEATSHLDPRTEARVEEAFIRRPGALVVVAHRMSSAYRAARILVMDGRQVQLGTHLSLLTDSPLYQDLAGRWNEHQIPSRTAS